MTDLYACHNRPAFDSTMLVQDGWRYFEDRDGFKTRVPNLVTIPFRGNPGCSYGNDTAIGRNDERCKGCKWRT